MKIDPSVRTVTFEELQDHLKTRYGIDVYDVNRKSDAFEQWCHRHDIPLKEARGAAPRCQEIWTQYIEAPDGHDIEPDYFNFWHFIQAAAEALKIEVVTTESCHELTVPLPTVKFAQALTLKQEMVRGRFIEYVRSLGVDPRRTGLPPLYREAPDLLNKIEADFGRPLMIYSETSR